MTTTLLLRIASVISLLFAVGHTLGGRKSWSPIGESQVLTTMRTVRFDTMGVTRSYLDFYRGFGFTLGVFLLLQAVLLWQLGSIAAKDRSATTPLVVAFLLASLVNGALTWKLILPVPALFWAALIACLGLTLVAGR